jgi:hypothetical protein
MSQNTPTFSAASRFATILLDISPLEPSERACRPRKTGSAMRTSGLSTWKYDTCSTPRARMSSIAPLAASARMAPPWPSGFTAIASGLSRMSLPSGVTDGIVPCGKRKVSAGLRPNQLLSRKNACVSASFSGLVMMYQGIEQL